MEGVAVTSSEDYDVGDMELWHTRLAHLIEKGIFQLHKTQVFKGIKSYL